MKTFLLALAFLSTSALATDINLSAGSSATVRAGDTATVTCQGGGGGDHAGGRCRCVVGNKNVNPLIDCGEDRVGYVVLVNGAPVAKDGCWYARDVDSAGRACLQKLSEQSQCK